RGSVVAFLFILIGVAAWVLITGGSHGERFSRRGLFSDALKPSGIPRLVSVEPLPETTATEGEICQWAVASANQSPHRKGAVAASEIRDRALALAALPAAALQANQSAPAAPDAADART